MSDRLVSLCVSGDFIQIMVSNARAMSKTQMSPISQIFSPTFINMTLIFTYSSQVWKLGFQNLRFLGTL